MVSPCDVVNCFPMRFTHMKIYRWQPDKDLEIFGFLWEDVFEWSRATHTLTHNQYSTFTVCVCCFEWGYAILFTFCQSGHRWCDIDNTNGHLRKTNNKHTVNNSDRQKKTSFSSDSQFWLTSSITSMQAHNVCVLYAPTYCVRIALHCARRKISGRHHCIITIELQFGCQLQSVPVLECSL